MSQANTPAPGTIQALQSLEYAIRQSMPVRDDQEDTADPAHLTTAAQLGIKTHAQLSKGDLLSLVQTRLRAEQARR